MRIKIYSYSNYSTAQDWAGYFRTAFMENTVASQNPWDSAYQINITNVSSSKTQAISKILSNTPYHEVTFGNGVYNIKIYSYSSNSMAQEWAGYFNLAFNLNSNNARVSPMGAGYQINIPNLNSLRSQAISKALSNKPYHEISNDETTPPSGGKTLNVPNIYQYSFNTASGYQPGFGDSACYASCYLAIAKYDGYNISMNTLIANGDVNGNSGYVSKYTYLNVGGDIVSSSPPLSTIKNEINNNRPVIVKLQQGANTHFFVIYGYTGSGTSSQQFLVMDPGYSPQVTTLDIAISRQKPFYSIRKTTKK